MMKGIRRSSFAKPGPATFLAAESGIRMLNFLPQSQLEQARIQLERKSRERSALPTYAEDKKDHRAPRMPPTTWAEYVSLLTTHCLFIEMLFGRDNLHVQGVQAVKDQILNMADIMDVMSNMYFAQVCWAVIKDTRRYSNKPCVMADFRNLA